MRVVTICLPESYVEGVDKLIGQNKYPNRSEVIRIAIRDLLVDELWGERKVSGGIPLVTQLERMALLTETTKPNRPA
jgi:antitoxin ParD1/3/4